MRALPDLLWIPIHPSVVFSFFIHHAAYLVSHKDKSRWGQQ